MNVGQSATAAGNWLGGKRVALSFWTFTPNRIMQSKFSALFLIFIFLGVGFYASTMAAATPAAGGGDSEAWTGVITYTRTQSQADSKTIERVSGRGKDTRNWEMNYNYKATVGVLESPEKNGSSIGQATIAHSFSSKETSVAVEKNSCDRGKTWRDMTGTFTSETKISGQGKKEADVNIGVNDDGTYSVSVGVPEIDGTITGSQTSSFSGQCTPKKGQNHTMPATPTKIQGQRLTSDGSTRVDPNDANKLAGSYSLSLPGGVVESITWNLQRHVTPLRIVDLKFEDMKYPNWNDWHEITEQVGTVDGNWVKIKVTVFNGSGTTKTGEVYIKETYKGDKWDAAKPDMPLKDQTFTITLEAGEQREVEMLWDTSGYAWYDDGRPRLVQRIKAELWTNAKKIDDKTLNLKIAPKPLVLVSGLWTDPNEMEIYQNILTATHSYDWKACIMPVAHGSVYTVADNLNTYVNSVRKDRNAWHVDMLGHGTGGLVARLYVHKQMEIAPDSLPVVKHLLLLGTPNNGINCTTVQAGLFASDEDKQTIKELAPEEMALFNQYVTQRKGTKFSALAGNLVPIPCGLPDWSDGRVTETSAKHGIEDVTVVKSLHTDLLGTGNFTQYVRPHLVTGPQGTYQPPFPVQN